MKIPRELKANKNTLRTGTSFRNEKVDRFSKGD